MLIMDEADTRATDILKQWASLRGHDRCWWYPEFVQPLADIYLLSLEGITLTPKSSILFKEGCARFRREQYHQGTYSFNIGGITARDFLSSWIESNRGKEMTYHDEVLGGLATILNVKVPSTPNVSESELQQGCVHFQLTQYKI